MKFRSKPTTNDAVRSTQQERALAEAASVAGRNNNPFPDGKKTADDTVPDQPTNVGPEIVKRLTEFTELTEAVQEVARLQARIEAALAIVDQCDQPRYAGRAGTLAADVRKALTGEGQS